MCLINFKVLVAREVLFVFLFGLAMLLFLSPFQLLTLLAIFGKFMYYLLYGFLYLLSLLPMKVLYLLSDFAYFIIYRVVKYRRDVVMRNLTIAFPGKSEEERNAIAKKFYRNFTDNFIETIKLITAGEKFLRRHFKCDLRVFNELYAQGRKCRRTWDTISIGKWPTWPWLFTRPTRCFPCTCPLTVNRLIAYLKKLRAKTGAVLLPATKMSAAMTPWRDKQYLLALVADQNPGVPSKAYWLSFFGRPTPFVRGPEKGARANDAAVVFVHITKPRRGYYETHVELAASHPAEMPEGDLTKKYIRYLERVITEHPEMWLWTHRRWKHEWKPGYPDVIA